jgi:hypothetical protein
MTLTETQVANRRSLGLKDDATTGQVFDVIATALEMKRLPQRSEERKQQDRIGLNKGLTKGATPHRTSPPVKQYICADQTCGAPMQKTGSGLGKWRCSKNKTHTRAWPQKVA